MVRFPNCKINIGLNILGKRTDGYHDLETVFVPVPFTDILEIIPNNKENANSFTITGHSLPGGAEDNLCIKAYALLKKRVPSLPPVKMHLHKIIPSGAGLGGGSSNAAFTLKILNTVFECGLMEKDLLQMALQLGSDCPFFIINKPRFARGRGERLKEIDLDLSAYRFAIVNPGIHISTAAMFSRITPAIPANPLNDLIKQPVENWKKVIKNDFEHPVFEMYPVIKEIKEALYKAGAVYVSLSGSGSSVYGIFKKNQSIDLSPLSGFSSYTTN